MADSHAPELHKAHTRLTEEALTALFTRMRDSFDGDVGRWERTLERVLFKRMKATATDFGKLIASQLRHARSLRFIADFMDAWLTAAAAGRASELIGDIDEELEQNGADEVFERLLTVGAALHARSLTTTAANFGAVEGARASNASTKTWRTNSGNPRSSHASVSGETVPLEDNFSNGMAWPGDPSGGAANVANCRCSVSFNRD